MNDFTKHCDSDLFTVKYHLLDHMGENIRRFRTLPVPESGPSECFNVHVRKAYRRTSQKGQTKTIEIVNVMERWHERLIQQTKATSLQERHVERKRGHGWPEWAVSRL